MFYFILTAVLVLLDQAVKLLVRAQIPLGESVPFLPYVMNLTYVQNTGAAFSLFTEHTWALTLISLAVSLLLAAAMVKGVFSHRFPQTALAVVLAGAGGNLIDRAALGFVTDMFQTTFMNFAVFNVADICVVLGGIALCGYLCLVDGKREKKEEPSHDAPDADG